MLMLDIPHAGALPAIPFDNLIRMPVGEDINRVLSRPIPPSCLEGCWLLPRLRSCLAHSDHTAALSRAKISALLTSRGQGGPKGTHMDSSTLRCRRFGRQGESKHRGTALSGGLIGGETKCRSADVSFASLLWPQDRRARTRSTSVASAFIHT